MCWNWKKLEGTEDCGCTAYSKKRRMLRQHRDLLRVAEEILEDNELYDDYEDLASGEMAFPASKVYMDHLDEDSDVEDPEAELLSENARLRAEIALLREERDNLQSMQQVIQLATASLERGALVQELEEARALLSERSGPHSPR